MRIATIGLQALVTIALAGAAFTASAAPYRHDGAYANHRVVHHRRFMHPVRHHHRVVHRRAVVRGY